MVPGNGQEQNGDFRLDFQATRAFLDSCEEQAYNHPFVTVTIG